MPKQENGLPGKWELLKDHAFDAQVVSIHTGAIERDQWCEMNFRQAEALILIFSASSYFLPSFLSSMTKLKVLIVLNYGSKRATVNGLLWPSSLPQLKNIRLERLNVPPLQKQVKIFQNLEKLSLSICGSLTHILALKYWGPFPNFCKVAKRISRNLRAVAKWHSKIDYLFCL